MFHSSVFSKSPYFLIGMILACTTPAPVKKSFSDQDRRVYLEQRGTLIPQRLKDPFIQGKATQGMTKEMIVFLYGPPSRTESNHYGIRWSDQKKDSLARVNLKDSVWNYLKSDSLTVEKALVFQGDTVARVLGEGAQ